ncbi:UNVERIFIED_CONTAM: hypothetical protein Slati_0288100 [Sesamum latifolium]|uniref:SWIM-type domain-containing protein n=1 Tax=Sesamum latifolium TaxID=2727402 RepID=A0AAW2YE89_9LAMI
MSEEEREHCDEDGSGEEGEDCDEDSSTEEGEGSHKEGEENNSGDELSSINLMTIVRLKTRVIRSLRMNAWTVLREYVIQEGFQIMRLRNEKTRVTAHCASKDCPWRIHASPLADGVTFQIKTYVSTHTCVRSDSTKEASAIWIASKIENVLRENPGMKARGIRNELRKFEVNPQYMQIYRAKKKAMECDVEEDEIIPSTPIFKRFFLGLPALRDGFLEGYSPFMGFDGCHLKEPFGGVLLPAIGLDGNNGLFPVAVAVAESECKESWMFFFENLSRMLGGFTYDKPWTFMSDRQKVNTLTFYLYTVMHEFDYGCLCNASILLGAALKRYFWQAARSVAGDFEFEVHDQNVNYIVNLKGETCNCMVWDISGIPCKHAALGIAHRREDIESYTDNRFSTAKYMKAYRHSIHPIPDPSLWPQDLKVSPSSLLPPVIKKLPGRPKKSRRKEPGEVPNTVRRAGVVRCKSCNQLGHNRRTCPINQYKSKDSELDVTLSQLAKNLKKAKGVVGSRKRKSNQQELQAAKSKKTKAGAPPITISSSQPIGSSSQQVSRPPISSSQPLLRIEQEPNMQGAGPSSQPPSHLGAS